MKTYIFIPPTSGSTGGIAVLFQIGRILNKNGFEAVFVLREKHQWILDALGKEPYVMWDDAAPTPKDIWLVPEGWVNAFAKGLQAGARCYNYCQNWAYLHSALPENVQWNTLPVSFIGVSKPVSAFVQKALRLEQTPPVLRPGIDLSRFFPEPKRVTPKGITVSNGSTIKIAYMPRKNKALAKQIQDFFLARNPDAPVRFIAIENMTPEQVATTLRTSHIFLVTGFPEGCPLPPLEAMASGCLPVGFAGYGGWDYMRNEGTETNYTPLFELRKVPWSANGLWCADGDVLDCSLKLEQAVGWFLDAKKGTETPATAILANAQQTAKAYSEEKQAEAVIALWNSIS